MPGWTMNVENHIDKIPDPNALGGVEYSPTGRLSFVFKLEGNDGSTTEIEIKQVRVEQVNMVITTNGEIVADVTPKMAPLLGAPEPPMLEGS